MGHVDASVSDGVTNGFKRKSGSIPSPRSGKKPASSMSRDQNVVVNNRNSSDELPSGHKSRSRDEVTRKVIAAPSSVNLSPSKRYSRELIKDSGPRMLITSKQSYANSVPRNYPANRNQSTPKNKIQNVSIPKVINSIPHDSLPVPITLNPMPVPPPLHRECIPMDAVLPQRMPSPENRNRRPTTDQPNVVSQENPVADAVLSDNHQRHVHVDDSSSSATAAMFAANLVPLPPPSVAMRPINGQRLGGNNHPNELNVTGFVVRGGVLVRDQNYVTNRGNSKRGDVASRPSTAPSILSTGKRIPAQIKLKSGLVIRPSTSTSIPVSTGSAAPIEQWSKSGGIAHPSPSGTSSTNELPRGVDVVTLRPPTSATMSKTANSSTVPNVIRLKNGEIVRPSTSNHISMPFNGQLWHTNGAQILVQKVQSKDVSKDGYSNTMPGSASNHSGSSAKKNYGTNSLILQTASFKTARSNSNTELKSGSGVLNLTPGPSKQGNLYLLQHCSPILADKTPLVQVINSSNSVSKPAAVIESLQKRTSSGGNMTIGDENGPNPGQLIRPLTGSTASKTTPKVGKPTDASDSSSAPNRSFL